MIDIHCHILPGMDDGPEQLEHAMTMAEDAIADGITHVIATPHANNHYHFDYQRVRRIRGALQERLGDRLHVATGCDFHLSPENLAALKVDPARFCLNQRNYLLVEFDEFAIPPSMDQTLHQLQLAGLRPIITHPERNGILRAQPDRLLRWVRMGCSVQVTAGALTAGFGPGAQRDAEEWIGRGLVHLVASDAHNTRNRRLLLSPAYEALAARFDEDLARNLLIENPRAVFEGRPLPYVPEVLDEKPRRRRKRFFFF